MRMLTAAKTFHWCSSHRLMHHEGKCARLHGHNYRAQVEFVQRSPALQADGMVLDFGVIGDAIGGWIDEYLDHNCLLNKVDTVARQAISVLNMAQPAEDARNTRVMLFPCDPTAEAIAAALLTVARRVIERMAAAFPDVEVGDVQVWETDTCLATCAAVIAAEGAVREGAWGDGDVVLQTDGREIAVLNGEVKQQAPAVEDEAVPLKGTAEEAGWKPTE